MMRPGWGAWIALVAGALALAAGVVLLVLQAPMTEMRDAEAFERDVFGLYTDDLSRETVRKMTSTFHDLRREQDTGKNAMFDAGVGLLAAGALALAITGGIAWSRGFRAFMRGTHGIGIVVLGCLLAAAAIVSGWILTILIDYDRFAYPPWADSLGIPLSGVPIMLGVVFAILFLLSAVPYMKARSARIRLFGFPARIGTIVSTVLYGLLAAGFATLAAWMTVETAGWLIGPGYGLATWLMLHARAVSAE